MNRKIRFMSDFLAIYLLPIESLKPHEQYCPDNFNYWLEQIAMKKHWTHPLLVHKDTKIIMDGHHRYQIARKLGLKHIPCVLTSYTNPYLKVYFHRDNSILDDQLIIEAGQSGKLFDKKSTRHELAFNCIPQTNIPLTFLQ
jgi:hypothetical protein